jgi:excinuclease UvrABC nuclease subunit
VLYYFYDEEGRVLFVGKGKEYQTSGSVSLSEIPLEKQKDALTAFISDLDYEVTGNDMIATTDGSRGHSSTPSQV